MFTIAIAKVQLKIILTEKVFSNLTRKRTSKYNKFEDEHLINTLEVEP